MFGRDMVSPISTTIGLSGKTPDSHTCSGPTPTGKRKHSSWAAAVVTSPDQVVSAKITAVSAKTTRLMIFNLLFLSVSENLKKSG